MNTFTEYTFELTNYRSNIITRVMVLVQHVSFIK